MVPYVHIPYYMLNEKQLKAKLDRGELKLRGAIIFGDGTGPRRLSRKAWVAKMRAEGYHVRVRGEYAELYK